MEREVHEGCGGRRSELAARRGRRGIVDDVDDSDTIVAGHRGVDGIEEVIDETAARRRRRQAMP